MLIRYLLDLLYPEKPRCHICGRGGAAIACETCMASMDYLQGITCIHCGKQLSDYYIDSVCPDCRNRAFFYDRAFSCFEYKGMGKQIIYKLKYEGKTKLSRIIADLMLNRLENENLKFDAIVPVPIHENKLTSRGFNQSLVIAEELGRRLCVPVVDCLLRTRDTKEQFSLDRVQRYMNIVDAFSVRLLYNVCKYKCILLVDDIYTTGSTVNECSRVLKKHGAGHVYVITAATGSNT